ncbi:MAG: SUMF1/EgtB/PvdO family nonheme iron enzyme [Planctomycetota bacterium]
MIAEDTILPEEALLEGELLWRAGRRDEALQRWTEALARASDEPTREALAARLARAHRGSALRLLGGPLLLGAGLLALALAGGARLAERADARRTRDAARALTDARAGLADEDPRPALEALRGVVERYPGSDAAGEARELARRFAEHLRAAEDALRAAQARLERGAREPAELGRALRGLEAALSDDAFPQSAPSRALRRLRDEAARADRLRRGKEALEEQRFADAAAAFASERGDDARARRGFAAAQVAQLGSAAQAAVERGELGQALELLRRANAQAGLCGRAPLPTDELEARWRALRALRARLACLRATDLAARGQLAAARAALELRDPPEEELLRRRVAGLAATLAQELPAGMVLLPGGRFPRGGAGAPDELPLELAEVEPFLLERREVTRGEFQRFLAASGRAAPPGWRAPAGAGEEREPARGVSQEDAAAYAAFRGARLPTELEWEAAARLERALPASERELLERDAFEAAWAEGLASASRALEDQWRQVLAQRAAAQGAAKTPDLAAPDLSQVPGDPRPQVDRAAGKVTVSPAAALGLLLQRRYPWGGFWDASRCLLGGERPTPAGAAGASPWGIEDLAGSVAEWTASEYLPYGGALRSASEGKGQVAVRGGSFRAAQGEEVRAGLRLVYGARARFDDLGFRCARSVVR